MDEIETPEVYTLKEYTPKVGETLFMNVIQGYAEYIGKTPNDLVVAWDYHNTKVIVGVSFHKETDWDIFRNAVKEKWAKPKNKEL